MSTAARYYTAITGAEAPNTFFAILCTVFLNPTCFGQPIDAQNRYMDSNLYRSGWLVIHIQRRRLCDLALSQQVAQLTNHYGPYMPTKQPDPTLIAVTPDSFIQQMQHCTDTMRGELQTLAGIPRLRVIYEADLCNQVETNRTCSAIFTTLGIEQRPVTTSRTRSWNRQYSELIPTFDELQALMQMEKSLELQAVWDRFFMED